MTDFTDEEHPPYHKCGGRMVAGLAADCPKCASAQAADEKVLAGLLLEAALHGPLQAVRSLDTVELARWLMARGVRV